MKKMTPKRQVGRFGSSEKYRESVPGGVGLNSHQQQWQGLTVTEFFMPGRIRAEQGSVPAMPAHNIAFAYSGGVQAEYRVGGGHWQAATLAEGQWFAIPAGQSVDWNWDSWDGKPIVNLGFHLSPYVLERAAEQVLEVDPSRVELQQHINFKDPLMEQLAHGLRSELEKGGVLGKVYVETVVQLMSLHLLRNYCGQSSQPKEYRGGFSRPKLKQILDYIESHLDENITLEYLAKSVNMSVFHFMSMFKGATNQAPHQYIIHCRMTKAEKLLRETELSIMDIALQVGYQYPGHFSNAFKQFTGFSPSNYRKR